MAKGLTNKAIAKELSITEGTVKVHLNKVFQKFGIHRRTKLAVKILRELKLLLALPPRRRAKSSAPKARAFK
jgi:DNA-binding NarL/FixJ family response regulator